MTTPKSDAEKTPKELAEDYLVSNKFGSSITPIQDSFLAGYQAAQPKWIPISSPPEVGQIVLCCDLEIHDSGDGPIYTGTYEYGTVFGFADGEYSHTDVTHWMPLPPLPPKP